jgi:hypothetical protein
MSCQNFEAVITELAREQMMDAGVRENAINHLHGCSSCASRYQAEQSLTESLRSFSQSIKLESVNSEFESRLLAEFRSVRDSEGAGVRTRTRFWAYAAAAVLLMAIGVVAYRVWTSPQRAALPIAQNQDSPVRPTESIPAPVVPQPDKDRIIETDKAGKKPVRRATRGPRETRTVTPINIRDTVANNGSREVTTAFIPIGYAPVMSVQEGGEVVRVELSRAAMVRFGFPVNMDRLDEKVKADVLVSTDGLARAIRFVQ